MCGISATSIRSARCWCSATRKPRQASAEFALFPNDVAIESLRIAVVAFAHPDVCQLELRAFSRLASCHLIQSKRAVQEILRLLTSVPGSSTEWQRSSETPRVSQPASYEGWGMERTAAIASEKSPHSRICADQSFPPARVIRMRQRCLL